MFIVTLGESNLPVVEKEAHSLFNGAELFFHWYTLIHKVAANVLSAIDQICQQVR